MTAMIKKSKMKYLYNGEKLHVKEICNRNKKRKGYSRYPLFEPVTIEKDGESIPAKLCMSAIKAIGRTG